MATEFLKLSPGKRRRLIHHVRDGVREKAGLEPDPVFPSPSETWIRRMECALADTDYSQRTVDDLAHAFQQYLATLTEEERKALRLRLHEFISVRDAIVKATG
jgi:DNA-directed RNA polymerase specialized sigma24 family protein